MTPTKRRARLRLLARLVTLAPQYFTHPLNMEIRRAQAEDTDYTCIYPILGIKQPEEEKREEQNGSDPKIHTGSRRKERKRVQAGQWKTGTGSAVSEH